MEFIKLPRLLNSNSETRDDTSISLNTAKTGSSAGIDNRMHIVLGRTVFLAARAYNMTSNPTATGTFFKVSKYKPSQNFKGIGYTSGGSISNYVTCIVDINTDGDINIGISSTGTINQLGVYIVYCT